MIKWIILKVLYKLRDEFSYESISIIEEIENNTSLTDTEIKKLLIELNSYRDKMRTLCDIIDYVKGKA